MNRLNHIQTRLGRVSLCVVVLCQLLVGGCEPMPAETDQQVEPDRSVQVDKPTDSDDEPVVYWQPRPTRVRVYPSTRFIQESGRAILEARFELYDEMGDPVKAAGTFRIELHRVDESLGNVPQRMLYTWNAETITLAQQREHYDPITRGYLFRLGVDNLRIARQATLLRVFFTPVEGPRLETEAIIRSDW